MCISSGILITLAQAHILHELKRASDFQDLINDILLKFQRSNINVTTTLKGKINIRRCINILKRLPFTTENTQQISTSFRFGVLRHLCSLSTKSEP